MNLLKTSLAYFAGVFCIGFILGVIRVALVVEHLGVHWAELLEQPVMVLASYFVAKVCLRRFGPFAGSQHLGIGLLALALMIAAELALSIAMGQGIAEYLAGRDPVAGTAYLVSLVLFALMPWIAGQVDSN
jgi:hypothetical protein